VRAEQSDSGTIQSLAYGLDGPGPAVAELPDELVPNSRTARPTSRHTRAIEHLLSSAHEELGAVREILRGLRCSARLLSSDGSVIPLHRSASSIDASNSDTGALYDPSYGHSRISRTPALSTPIYDSEGRHFVSLQVMQGAPDYPVSSHRLLRALIECTARSITERYFRLAHRHEWVVAAMRRDSPGSYVLFAVDQCQNMVGADRKARQWLETRGLRFERSLALATLFRSGVGRLPPRSCGDAEATFVTGSGEEWLGLVTSPDIGAGQSFLDQRAVLHARPRLNSLTHSLPGADGCRQHDLAHESFRCAASQVCRSMQGNTR
jgi:hypothetical protein